MKTKAREALDAYYREAGSWAEDNRASLGRSRRTAWIVAGVTSAIALIEAAALMALTPLKTVEPYTLLVDKQTGYVQALKPLDVQQVSANAALTQSFLVQYVIAREGFDAATLQANYRKVSLWSGGEARKAYTGFMQANNPDSPLVRLPRSAVVESRVKSVSPLGKNEALVRFDTIQRDANGAVQPARAWVSVVRYRYSGAQMSLEDRFVNPLGFEVVHYRRDAEALPVAEPVAAPGNAPSDAPPTTQPTPKAPAQ
jgi:type IV secretion system protein VirB8